MTFSVFPVWNYSEESGDERLCLHKLYLVISLGVIYRNGIVGLDGKCIFNFMRNPNVFQSIGTILHFCPL